MAYRNSNDFRPASAVIVNGRGEKPDFKGQLEVAAWWNYDSQGQRFLVVRLKDRIALLPNPDKQEQADSAE